MREFSVTVGSGSHLVRQKETIGLHEVAKTKMLVSHIALLQGCSISIHLYSTAGQAVIDESVSSRNERQTVLRNIIKKHRSKPSREHVDII